MGIPFRCFFFVVVAIYNLWICNTLSLSLKSVKRWCRSISFTFQKYIYIYTCVHQRHLCDMCTQFHENKKKKIKKHFNKQTPAFLFRCCCCFFFFLLHITFISVHMPQSSLCCCRCCCLFSFVIIITPYSIDGLLVFCICHLKEGEKEQLLVCTIFCVFFFFINRIPMTWAHVAYEKKNRFQELFFILATNMKT